MATDEATRSMDRTLKEISSSLKEINKALKAMNNNYVGVNRTSTDSVRPAPEEKPLYLGWNTAASKQIDGTLKVGDIKYEQDGSHWYWTGGDWCKLDQKPLPGFVPNQNTMYFDWDIAERDRLKGDLRVGDRLYPNRSTEEAGLIWTGAAWAPTKAVYFGQNGE